MTGIEIKELIAGLGLPYAYYQFTKQTATAPPFICYYLAESADFAADGINYEKIRQLIIELYTEQKDFELETLIENRLTAAELFFTRNETAIDSEQMYMVTFTTEILFK